MSACNRCLSFSSLRRSNQGCSKLVGIAFVVCRFKGRLEVKDHKELGKVVHERQKEREEHTDSGLAF